MSNDQRAQAHNALKQAERAAKRGAIAEAERWSKIAERCAVAVEKLAATPSSELDAQAAEDEEIALRAEFMERLQRLADAQNEMDAWKKKSDAYKAAVAHAIRTNGPMPPPVPPWPYRGEEELTVLERIASGN